MPCSSGSVTFLLWLIVNQRSDESGIYVLYVFAFLDSGDDGIAQGSDAFTMLDYTQTRNNYINEILEVCSIFRWRVYT